MDVISLRVDNMDNLNFFSDILKEKKSKLVRDLINQGKKMKALELYKNNKVSLGLASKLAELTKSEFIDLLEEFNIPLNLTLDDAKQSYTHSKLL